MGAIAEFLGKQEGPRDWDEEKERKDFYAKLFKILVPVVIQSFMMALVSASDAIMLGFVDQASLSSSSLAGQIQFILNFFIFGVTGGTAILCAQYWGKKDIPTMERIIPIGMRLMFVVGFLFTMAAALIPEQLMAIYTNEPELILNGARYLRAVSFSYLFCCVSQVYLTVLKNTDRAAISSTISSCVVVINIVLNAILIFGLFGAPALGIVGAAMATSIARGIEVVWCILVVVKDNSVKVRWNRMFSKEPELTKDFLKYAMPSLGAMMVWGLAFSQYSVILGHMGSDAVAANSIANIAKQLASCLVRGLSAGTSIMMGNILGLGLFEQAKRQAMRFRRLSVLVGGLSGIILVLISPLVLMIAPLTETALSYLRIMIILAAFNTFGQCMNAILLNGIFPAGGDAKYDMYGNIGAMWCFSVPLGYLAAFVFKWPVVVVYLVVHLDEFVKMPVVFRRYYKYIWLRNITKEQV